MVVDGVLRSFGDGSVVLVHGESGSEVLYFAYVHLCGSRAGQWVAHLDDIDW